MKNTMKPLTDPNRSELMVEGEGDPWEGPQALSEQHMSPVLFLTLDWKNNFLHVTLQIQERKVKLSDCTLQTVGKPSAGQQGQLQKRVCVGHNPTEPGTSEHRESWAVQLSCPVSSPGVCRLVSHVHLSQVTVVQGACE